MRAGRNSKLGSAGELGESQRSRIMLHYANQILWVYIVLLVIGGMVGFLKAGSKISLIMSASFAAALSLCAARIIFQPYVADILLAALLVVFAMRFSKSRKFMPGGLMLLLTIAALALRHF